MAPKKGKKKPKTSKKPKDKPKDPSKRLAIAGVLGGVSLLGLGAAFVPWERLYPLEFSWLEPHADLYGHDGEWHKARSDDKTAINFSSMYALLHTYERKGEIEIASLPAYTQVGLRKSIGNKGLTLQDITVESLTQKDWGVPLPKNVARDLERFCRVAEDFLRDNVKGIDERLPGTDWTIIRSGDNYSRDFTTNGFTRYSTDFDGMGAVQYGRLIDESLVVRSNRGKTFNAGGATYSPGSSAKMLRMEAVGENGPRYAGLGYWYILLSSQLRYIGNVFSELIPRATIGQHESEYRHKHGDNESNRAVEALSESMSYHLALGLGEQLNIPNYGQMIEQMRTDLFGQNTRLIYRDVDKAIKWIGRNGGFKGGGVQKAWNMYNNSIEGFMQAIRKPST